MSVDVPLPADAEAEGAVDAEGAAKIAKPSGVALETVGVTLEAKIEGATTH